jgi:oxalate decarboxylase
MNRRSFLGAAAAAISASALIVPTALAQSREEIHKGLVDNSKSNPGPINKPLQAQNAASFLPEDTDAGDVESFWYSFELAHRRVQDGGWTRQVTQIDLPQSKDLAGVNMRITAGSYRELHWHTSGEWAMMLTGSARITLLSPDGKIFIDDVKKGDLWFFPAGYPHSIQGLGPDGCEFLLVFDNALFSEYQTFGISDWVAHTPPELLEKSMNLPASAVAKFPRHDEYIMPGTIPGSLEADREAVGGDAVMSKIAFSFHMDQLKPKYDNAQGSVSIVDQSNFPASTISMAMVVVKPGAVRELHWHANASEWQYWIQGTGRMSVFVSGGKARTMDFHAQDVGYVPQVAGHIIENIGTEDLIFLEMFKNPHYSDFSLNQWVRRLPEQIVKEHLYLDSAEIKMIPDAEEAVRA